MRPLMELDASPENAATVVKKQKQHCHSEVHIFQIFDVRCHGLDWVENGTYHLHCPQIQFLDYGFHAHAAHFLAMYITFS